MGMDQIWKILLQLLAPFIIGHLLRPWLTGWATKNKAILTLSDRSSIVLAVYTAFSAAVVEGLWSKVSIWALATVIGVNAVLLVAAAFEGQSRVARSRAVHAALGEEFATGLHALALTLRTPSEQKVASN